MDIEANYAAPWNFLKQYLPIPLLDTGIKVQPESKRNIRVIGASRQIEQPEQV